MTVNFGIKTLLLIVATFLFILAALNDSNWSNLVAWGLGALAAAFLLADIGWDRKYGGGRRV